MFDEIGVDPSHVTNPSSLELPEVHVADKVETRSRQHYLYKISLFSSIKRPEIVSALRLFTHYHTLTRRTNPWAACLPESPIHSRRDYCQHGASKLYSRAIAPIFQYLRVSWMGLRSSMSEIMLSPFSRPI